MFFLQVTIQRRLLSIILTTFLPTLIVNIVGHMSNYFKEFFFEGLISTNVTVLLVITTLFISVSESLPTTAYIKMIDVWLIFNLLKPFIDIIVQTYIESLREADTKVLGIKIYDSIPSGIFYIIAIRFRTTWNHLRSKPGSMRRWQITTKSFARR